MVSEGVGAASSLPADPLAMLVSALSDGPLQNHLLDKDAAGLFGCGVELLMGVWPGCSRRP